MLRYWYERQDSNLANHDSPNAVTSGSPKSQYDAIVVGAGPAGATAACFMSRQGMRVLLLERGPYPGAKNCGGAAIIAEHTHKLFPNFWESGIVERLVSDQAFWWMTEDSIVSSRFRSRKLAAAPYNRFTVKRTNLYRFLTAQALDAGVELLLSCRVDEILFHNGKACGVKITDSETTQYWSDIVILADGANSLLAEKAGITNRVTALNMSLYVKETIALPAAKIEERFGLLPSEGAVIGLFGYPTNGFNGTASIHTFRDSLTLNVGMSVASMSQAGIRPAVLLDRIKKHPYIQPLLEGGEIVEYGGAMIPEGGYYAIPKLVHDGLLLTGDAASLVNGVWGINLAMWSGYYAAQAAYAAKKAGDYSSQKLLLYKTLLTESFVLQDLKANAGVACLQLERPYLFDLYTRMINEGAYHAAKVYTMPKKAKRQFIFHKLISMQPLLKIVQDVWHVLKVMR